MEMKWIPIIEKQPEKSGRYFVTGATTVYDKINHKNIVIERTGTADYLKRDHGGSFWVVKQWHLDLDPFRFDHVDDNDTMLTAWMPFLEPYCDGDD